MLSHDPRHVLQVLTTRVPATSSPVERAKVLCEKIAEVYAGRSVHLIGAYFSMWLPWRAYADFQDVHRP